MRVGKEKMAKLVRIVLCGVVLVLMVSCLSTQERSDTPYRETIKVARAVGDSLTSESGNATAVSIAVIHEGEMIFSQGFGLRDREAGLPVDRYTRFNMGSVSKTFTAAAILLLQQDGKLDLDDAVVDVLPGFTMADQRYKDITIRMLLSHTSGMGGTNGLNGITSKRDPTYLTETLKELGQSSLKHDPGAFSPYCNDGFTVAQAVVEQLAGMSFAQFLQERIFDPLHLEHTSAGFLAGEDNIAYAYEDKTTRLPLEFVNIMASGGLTTTAEDLCRYALAVCSPMAATPAILQPESIGEFTTEQRPDFDLAMDLGRLLTHGLGWDFVSWEPYHQQGVGVLGKTGGTLHYTTMLFAIPESHSAVALVCSGQVNPLEATLPILDALLKETGIISSALEQTEGDLSPVVPLPEDYGSYEGFYGSDVGIYRIEFEVESSSLQQYACNDASLELKLTAQHRGNGIFEDDSGVRFALRTMLGTPSVLVMNKHYSQANLRMTRLPELHDAPLHAFSEGTWLPENLSSSDLIMLPFHTAFWDALPSYLVVTWESSIPYAITSASSTSMVLPAVRDQMTVRLAADNRLMLGAYRCIKTDDIAPLINGERIEAGVDTSSVWRSMQSHGMLSCEIPPGGRIIVLGSDCTNTYDSLYADSPPSSLDVDGGYVAFIADAPVVFQPSWQYATR